MILLPAATFTAPCAASVITFLPAVVKLLRSWFAALSIALRVSLSKPILTTPLAPVEITMPFLGSTESVVAVGLVVPASRCFGAAVPVPATKFKPFFSFTVCASASSALFARYVISASIFLTTNVVFPKSTLGFVGGVTVPVSGSVLPALPGFTVIVASPFLITKLSVPLPAISLILPRFSASFTSNPSPVAFFTTSMLFLAVASRVKFSAPFTFKASPKLRCTLSVSAVSLLP